MSHFMAFMCMGEPGKKNWVDCSKISPSPWYTTSSPPSTTPPTSWPTSSPSPTTHGNVNWVNHRRTNSRHIPLHDTHTRTRTIRALDDPRSFRVINSRSSSRGRPAYSTTTTPSSSMTPPPSSARRSGWARFPRPLNANTDITSGGASYRWRLCQPRSGSKRGGDGRGGRNSALFPLLFSFPLPFPFSFPPRLPTSHTAERSLELP